MVSKGSAKLTSRREVSQCSVCEMQLATIRITVDGNDLLMESCDKCDKRRWHLAGKQIDLQEALTEVKDHVGKRR